MKSRIGSYRLKEELMRWRIKCYKIQIHVDLKTSKNETEEWVMF